MATGIVAIACHLHGIPVVPDVLGGINWVAYGILWLLTLLRLCLYPRPLLHDLTDHLRGPGFFTIVAATSVLGSQTLTIEHAEPFASVLWHLTVGLWCVVMYAFLVAMAVTRRKPSLRTGINGAWLIAVVATQSIVVLGGALGVGSVPPPAIQFLFVVFFLVGGMLYSIIITLIFYRMSFFPLEPKAFGPLYWIDMGGAAISVLAGSTLILRANAWPVVATYLPFLKGATVFFWAAASYWIPFLVVMIAWRYLVRRDHIHYEPGLWGMVFPLGMYSTATFHLAEAESLPFLEPLSRAFAFAGLAMWLLTFLGLVLSLARAAASGGKT